jgi:hypothetical protein
MDPYEVAQQHPGMPGGFAGDVVFQLAHNQARQQGMISSEPLYFGDSTSMLHAMERRNQRELQTQMAQLAAMSDASNLADHMATFTSMGGREVSPELYRGYQSVAQTAMSLAAVPMMGSKMGQALLDTISGDVSKQNISHAVSNVFRYHRDPITGFYRPSEASLNSISQAVYASMSDHPRNALGEIIGPQNNRGFTGREIGNVMAGMQMRGQMPNGRQVRSLLYNDYVHRALDTGTITYDDIARDYNEPSLLESYLQHDPLVADRQRLGVVMKDRSQMTALEFATGSPANAMYHLRENLGMRDGETVRDAVYHPMDTLRDRQDEGRIDAARAEGQRARVVLAPALQFGKARTLKQLQDETLTGYAPMALGGALINRAAIAATGVELAGGAGGRWMDWLDVDGHVLKLTGAYQPYRKQRTFEQMYQEEFDASLLEYAAAVGKHTGFTEDDPRMNDLNSAIKATRANDTAAFNKTGFSLLTPDKKLDLVSKLTGVPADEISYVMQSYGGNAEYMRQDLAAGGFTSSIHDPLNVGAGILSRSGQTDGLPTQIVRDSTGKQVADSVAATVSTLSAIKEMMGDEGLNASIAELFQVMDQLASQSYHQIGMGRTEKFIREIGAGKDIIGASAEQMKYIATSSDALTQQYGLNPALSMPLQSLRYSTAAALAGMDASPVFGRLSQNQLSEVMGHMTAAAIGSEESGQMAAILNATTLEGFQFKDTAEGRRMEQVVKEYFSGQLSAENAKYLTDLQASGQLFTEFTSATVGTNVDSLQSRSQDRNLRDRVGMLEGVPVSNNRMSQIQGRIQFGIDRERIARDHVGGLLGISAGNQNVVSETTGRFFEHALGIPALSELMANEGMTSASTLGALTVALEDFAKQEMANRPESAPAMTELLQRLKQDQGSVRNFLHMVGDTTLPGGQTPSSQAALFGEGTTLGTIEATANKEVRSMLASMISPLDDNIFKLASKFAQQKDFANMDFGKILEMAAQSTGLSISDEKTAELASTIQRMRGVIVERAEALNLPDDRKAQFQQRGLEQLDAFLTKGDRTSRQNLTDLFEHYDEAMNRDPADNSPRHTEGLKRMADGTLPVEGRSATVPAEARAPADQPVTIRLENATIELNGQTIATGVSGGMAARTGLKDVQAARVGYTKDWFSR